MRWSRRRCGCACQGVRASSAQHLDELDKEDVQPGVVALGMSAEMQCPAKDGKGWTV